LRLEDVHEDYLRDPAALEQRVQRLASPVLGPLVEAWFAWLRDPATLSARTRRAYSNATVLRYEASWARFFAALARGKQSTIADLTKGFVADFRGERKRAGVTGATINRDLVALSAFLTWCEEERELAVTRPATPHERESAGRERWLNADELRTLLATMPVEWSRFFRIMAATGLRLGEMVASPSWKIGRKGPAPHALLRADVRVADQLITVVERRDGRRLKAAQSARTVPIAGEALTALAAHLVAFPGGPADPVFPAPFSYQQAQRVFTRAVKAAGLHDLRVHDLRHTFGVHAAQAGVPLPRLQKLMGHATPAMTMRYMQHAPGAYLAEDAAKIAASQSGARDREAEALRTTLVRRHRDTA
jgi:integrase